MREEDKKEFCRDVSSFANDSGGGPIIGIEDEQGVAKRLSGVEVANTDLEINRLLQIISYNIEPKIPGLEMAPVNLKQASLCGIRNTDSQKLGFMSSNKIS